MHRGQEGASLRVHEHVGTTQALRRRRAPRPLRRARAVRAQQLVRALLDDAEVYHHVGLSHALLPPHLPEEGHVATDARAQLLDALAQLADQRRVRAPPIVEGLSAGLRRTHAHLELLDVLMALRVHALVHPLVPLDLCAQLDQRFCRLVDLGDELVEVVEAREVLLLAVDELRHELVDVGDARGLLDLLERVLVRVHLLDVRVDGRLVLGHPPVRAAHLALELLLVVERELAAQLRVRHRVRLEPRLQIARHGLVHLEVLVQCVAQRFPLRLELALLALGRLAHARGGGVQPVSLLVRDVGRLDHLSHRALLLAELALELLVQRVEDEALAPQVVDLLAQLLVVRDRLVELDERLVEPVLEHLHLAVDRRIRLRRRVDAAHGLAVAQELLAELLVLLIQLRAPLPLELDPPRELVS
mmetsp:Transcript_3038/g.8004  ORF Transcript_3038/g.8004 Transcript_3038/m.8004 type:complete len:417 (-) Transcript_3038:318-1568(-)